MTLTGSVAATSTPKNAAPSQPQQQETGLTEEQAKQLLEAAAEGTESLEEYLQLIYGSPQSPSAQDW